MSVRFVVAMAIAGVVVVACGKPADQQAREDAEKKLPKELRARVAGHYQVKSIGDSAELAKALKGLAK